MNSSESTGVFFLWSCYLKISSSASVGKHRICTLAARSPSSPSPLNPVDFTYSGLQGRYPATLNFLCVQKFSKKKFSRAVSTRALQERRGKKKPRTFCNTSQKKNASNSRYAFLPQIVFLIYQNTCAFKYRCVCSLIDFTYLEFSSDILLDQFIQ